MSQMTLVGDVREMMLCVHCSWMGYDVVMDNEFKTCPRCGWVCYGLESAKRMTNCYSVLKDKVQKCR